jgi:N-acetylglucosaminyldiphosphoundecaprenol N-acetyl-beta-D-mannosaminyltransferase
MKYSILGTYIDNLSSYEETYGRVLEFIRSQSGTSYITINNVHTVIEALKDKSYREIINHSYLALPDGKPLSVIGKWKGIRSVKRIFGATFFEKTLEWGQKDDLKHFFFGSSEETLCKMKDVIKNRFPGAKIAGMISPPFKKYFSPEENNSFLEQINNSGADIVWVSLGAPKQEKWIIANYKNLNKGIMAGIGAGFDYLAGNILEAPVWMKETSLEWVYRLKQEPKRLWKRYLVNNPQFIFFVTLELLGLKKFR